MVKQVKPLEYKEVKKEMDEGEYVEVEFKDVDGERMDTNSSKTISIVCKLIAGICMLIAVIALWNMFSDFIEFGSYLAQLREGVPDYIWNDPRIQGAIAEGYAQLAKEPLTVAIPMIIVASVLLVISRVVVNRAGAPSKISQVKPITPMTVKQVSPITASEPIKSGKVKQVKPITQ